MDVSSDLHKREVSEGTSVRMSQVICLLVRSRKALLQGCLQRFAYLRGVGGHFLKDVSSRLRTLDVLEGTHVQIDRFLPFVNL